MKAWWMTVINPELTDAQIMHRSTPAFLFSMIAFYGLTSHALATDAPPVPSLCTTTEKTYLSCETENHKIISMCGALPNALQYRFGRPDKIELRYPDNASKASSVMLYGHLLDSSADRSDVNFSIGSYHYSVFDLRYHNGNRFTGVEVEGKGGTVYRIGCKGAIQGDLEGLDKYLKCDPNDAFNGGVEDGCHTP
jgi:hypothetical protein